jgi:hypothetical protein
VVLVAATDLMALVEAGVVVLSQTHQVVELVAQVVLLLPATMGVLTVEELDGAEPKDPRLLELSGGAFEHFQQLERRINNETLY